MTEHSEQLRQAATKPIISSGASAYFRKVFAVVAKDVAAELRTKEMLSSMFIFSLLVIIIFNFAFDLRADNVTILAPGVLWVVIAFAGMLGLSRSFILESDRGSLEGLLLAPVDRSAIYLGKMIGNILFIGLVEIIILPFFVIFFNQSIAIIPPLVGVVLLGTIGFSSVGTLFSAMAIHTRAREVLLPIMLFPVVVPVIIGSVRLTAAILDGTPFDEVRNWLALVAAFDAIFIAASFMLFDFVV
ncbi:MAG: heme exporter protein CcmB, partial [Anaerolineae bacterium]